MLAIAIPTVFYQLNLHTAPVLDKTNYRPVGVFSKSGREYRSIDSECPAIDGRRTDGRSVGSLGCLAAWLASCATRDGSSIPAAPGKVIERLNSVEKLRGTDLWHGQIGATLV